MRRKNAVAVSNHSIYSGVPRCDAGDRRPSDPGVYYSAMLYVNVPVLKSLLLASPAFLSLFAMPELECVEDLGNSLGYIHTWTADVLKQAKLKLNLCDFNDKSCWEQFTIGDVVAFNRGVRSRGKIGHKKERADRAGEIYIKSGQRIASMSICSRWITGDHARATMGHGALTLCGIFSIVEMNLQKDVMTCLPILLAEPLSQLARDVFPESCHLMCCTI